jgi:uncharacterized protein (TIGR02145 family)
MKAKGIKRTAFIGIQLLIIMSLTVNGQEIKDFDGNVYKTVKYGVQVWIGSNLNVTHFRNGDIIPEAKTEAEWIKAGKAGSPAWCNYDNDPENGKKYGKLYNWYAIGDKRGLVPEGWHVSANADWKTLIKNLLGVDVAGLKLKSTTDWKSKKGTNTIGFSAVPAGYRDSDGKFKDLGMISRWWSNSVPVEVKPTDQIYTLVISDKSLEVKYVLAAKGAGFSVRCEKD